MRTLLAVGLAVVIALPSGVGAFPLPLAAGPRLDRKVLSLKEARTVGIVTQQHDYSCGAAAVATLLTYHFGRLTTEEEVLDVMARTGSAELIKEKGFSLLDMKRFLDAIKYQSAGFKFTVEQLSSLKVPGIILIDTMTYQHFVVLKGVRDGLAFLADPALGNRAMRLEELQQAWNGVFLAALGQKKDDSQGFQLWKPEVRGLSRALHARDRGEHFIPLDPTMRLWDITKPVRNSPWHN
ncbi:MAG: C39 family peptidase [Pseudomonadota bacterium]